VKSLFKIIGLIMLLVPEIAEATSADTPSGYITFMAGGWTIAATRVQMSSTFTNPANCSMTDGYVVDPSDSGSQLFSSMLLSAYLAHRQVYLTIDGCSLSRPHIIGVSILPN